VLLLNECVCFLYTQCGRPRSRPGFKNSSPDPKFERYVFLFGVSGPAGFEGAPADSGFKRDGFRLSRRAMPKTSPPLAGQGYFAARADTRPRLGGLLPSACQKTQRSQFGSLGAEELRLQSPFCFALRPRLAGGTQSDGRRSAVRIQPLQRAKCLNHGYRALQRSAVQSHPAGAPLEHVGH
jgi:hypothetical protein